MGRVQLSTEYGLDTPVQKSPYPQPPRYLDAPFDFDADVDAPDTVYEAFVMPRGGAIPAFPSIDPREAAGSPIESVESDDTSSQATTQPSTRVSSPARLDRGNSPQRADSPADRGLRVLELLEPLTNARAAAQPAIQAAMADGVTEVRPLVYRLTSILRPHISTALAPFLVDIPEVEFLGHMFERSLILDMLSPEHMSLPSGAAFSRNDILTALDAAEEALYTTERPGVLESMPPARFNAYASEEFPVDPASGHLPIIDPAAEPLLPHAQVPQETARWVHHATPHLYSPRRPLSPGIPQPSLTLQRSVSPTSSVTSPSLRSNAMDVDTDDETPSNSSAGSSMRVRSYYGPRVFRSSDSFPRPRMLSPVPPQPQLLSINYFRSPSPLR